MYYDEITGTDTAEYTFPEDGYLTGVDIINKHTTMYLPNYFRVTLIRGNVEKLLAESGIISSTSPGTDYFTIRISCSEQIEAGMKLKVYMDSFDAGGGIIGRIVVSDHPTGKPTRVVGVKGIQRVKQSDVTLVNNTELTEEIEFDREALNELLLVQMLNGDDVERGLKFHIGTSTTKTLIRGPADSIAAGGAIVWPNSESAVLNRYPWPILNNDLRFLTLRWTAGGASSGGTGSYRVVYYEEIIEHEYSVA